MKNNDDEKHWEVISLGGGVQSSAMALMASCGELGPMPDCAVFADTQDEPASVYRWLDWLEPKLAFPVFRVSKGSLSESTLKMRTTDDGRKFSRTNIPFFTLNADGGFGMIPHRSCTSDFKIGPILKFLRSHCEIKRGQKHATVTSWIGISLDEQQRMKDSRDKWVVNRWPLVEKRIDRGGCVRWMLERGYPEPPKSACTYCPFHSNKEWRRLKNEEPEDFAKAVKFEKDIQEAKANTDNFASTPYLHASRKPLDTIDFRNDVDKGQTLLSFMDECEGMCGV
jgi:hypothetical protein